MAGNKPYQMAEKTINLNGIHRCSRGNCGSSWEKSPVDLITNSLTGLSNIFRVGSSDKGEEGMQSVVHCYKLRSGCVMYCYLVQWAVLRVWRELSAPWALSWCSPTHGPPSWHAASYTSSGTGTTETKLAFWKIKHYAQSFHAHKFTKNCYIII